MNRGTGLTVLAFLVIPLLLVCGSGCGTKQQTKQGYPNDYKSLMVSFRARVTELTSRPLPPKSASREEKRLALSGQVAEVAAVYSDTARKLRDLQPPAEFREIHEATISYFDTASEGNRRYGEAIKNGDRETRKKTLSQSEANELEALKRLQQALKKGGGDSAELESVINELAQDASQR